MTRGQVAAKVRAHKLAHPELYCYVPTCLWREKHDGAPDTPCQKHPKPLPQIELFSTPYPWCRGNPTREDCAKVGYCRRDPNCGE